MCTVLNYRIYFKTQGQEKEKTKKVEKWEEKMVVKCYTRWENERKWEAYRLCTHNVMCKDWIRHFQG
jgi:hypothetical protein